MATLGNVPAEAYTNTVKDSFSGNGSATAFTMSLPTVTNDVRVVVENVIQDPTVAYSVSGTTLTFTSAPPTGTNNIYVVHLGPAAMTAVPPAEIADATTFASSLTVQGAFTSKGIDDNADAVALTIDSSENVLIGQTTASSNTVGASLRPDGRNFYCADGNYSAHFNRKSSDGAIAHFAKDDNIVGSISAKSGDLVIHSSTTDHVGLMFGNTRIEPTNNYGTTSDNTVDLGNTDRRFKDLYLAGGVYLGGIGAANKLDDYEYGTWTPVYVGSSSSGSYTYVENQGHYIKIGNQVTCWFNLTNITTGTAGTGVSQINGLPFTVNWMAGFNGEGMGNVTCHGWTGIDGDQCWPLMTDGQSYVRVYKMTGTNNSPSPVEPGHKVDNGSDLRGFVTYTVSG